MVSFEEILRTPSVEPVACEEHRKEQHDPRVGPNGDPEAYELGFPGRVLGGRDSGAIGANHLGGLSHQERYEDTDAGEDEVYDLARWVSKARRLSAQAPPVGRETRT